MATAVAEKGPLGLENPMGTDGFEFVEYTAPVFWCFFLLTGITLFVLRWKDRDVVRSFRVPLYPLTPPFFCLTSAYLLYASLSYTGPGALAGFESPQGEITALMHGIATYGDDWCDDNWHTLVGFVTPGSISDKGSIEATAMHWAKAAAQDDGGENPTGSLGEPREVKVDGGRTVARAVTASATPLDQTCPVPSIEAIADRSCLRAERKPVSPITSTSAPARASRTSPLATIGTRRSTSATL